MSAQPTEVPALIARRLSPPETEYAIRYADALRRLALARRAVETAAGALNRAERDEIHAGEAAAHAREEFETVVAGCVP